MARGAPAAPTDTPPPVPWGAISRCRLCHWPMRPPRTVPAVRRREPTPLSCFNSPPRRCHCCFVFLCVCFDFFFLRDCAASPRARRCGLVDLGDRRGAALRRFVRAGFRPRVGRLVGGVCACLAFSFFSFLPPHSSPRLGFTPTQCALGVGSLWRTGRSWRRRWGRARPPLWGAPGVGAGPRRRWRWLRTVFWIWGASCPLLYCTLLMSRSCLWRRRRVSPTWDRY